MSVGNQGRSTESGFAMAALIVAITVMAVVMSVAIPVWKTAAQREREAELIFRGQQYARAIGLYQRKYANVAPPNIDVLVKERFLRKKYKDPMTEAGDFQPVYGAIQNAGAPGVPGSGGAAGQPGGQGQGPGQASQIGQARQGIETRMGGQAGAQGAGLIGVASKSTATGLRVYNGRSKYSEWAFVWQPRTVQAGSQAGGAAGAVQPGGLPGRGGPGGPAGPGGPGGLGGRSGPGGQGGPGQVRPGTQMPGSNPRPMPGR